MRTVTGYGAHGPGAPLRPVAFERRDLRPDDVAMRVRYCGVCHTDLHAVEAPPPGHLPLVPGHEFVGEVTATGAEVSGFAVGDAVAVGNIVDSCGACPPCRAGREVFCTAGVTPTYLGTPDRRPGPAGRLLHRVRRERAVRPPLPRGAGRPRAPRGEVRDGAGRAGHGVHDVAGQGARRAGAGLGRGRRLLRRRTGTPVADVRGSCSSAAGSWHTTRRGWSCSNGSGPR